MTRTPSYRNANDGPGSMGPRLRGDDVKRACRPAMKILAERANNVEIVPLACTHTRLTKPVLPEKPSQSGMNQMVTSRH